ncbi:MAG: uracil-DNA glycosylase [Pseudomonadota bacterium]|nr:uracil-DNA glycosylase [Pseudomonadota bacterium]
METKTETACDTWQSALTGEKDKPYFKEILAYLDRESTAGKTIYPPRKDIFNALKSTPFDQVKVVILGQDPYHGPGQAHGLCFSVRPGVAPPPSLKNIFEELRTDVGIPLPKQGCLQKWTEQGVLLLNTVLSVEEHQAHSHAKIGWETFTDQIINVLNEKRDGIVFLLWGAHAQKKCAIIDANRHYLLRAAHPSPLSAHRGFLGCKHFSKCNNLLQQMGKKPIDWNI